MALKKVEEKEDLKVGGSNEQSQSVSTEPVTDNVDVPEEEGTQETQMVSMDAFKQMLEEQEKRFEQRLAEERKKITELAKSSRSINDDSQRGEDLLDDYLEKPITFFSYSFTYSLYSDLRRGKESTPPNGGIKFRPLVRSKKQSAGRGVTVTSICAVKSNSKAEVEWLRSSPLFGITFHESVTGAMSLDSTLTQILINANQEVQRLSDHDVVAKSTALGLSPSTDIDLMRRTLSDHLAKQKKAQSDNYYEGQRKSIEQMVLNEETGNMAMVVDKNKTH